jgi:hypothetical protein
MLDMMSDPKLSGDNPEVLLVTDYWEYIKKINSH